MPNIKSAKKKMRQDVKKTSMNKKYSKKLDDVLINIRKTGKGSKNKDLIKKAYSAVDKAAKKNIVHKNKAARLKSRISRLIKS